MVLLYVITTRSNNNQIEHCSGNTTADLEAIQTIASMYNDDKLTLVSLILTGDVNFSGGNINGVGTIAGAGNTIKISGCINADGSLKQQDSSVVRYDQGFRLRSQFDGYYATNAHCGNVKSDTEWHIGTVF